MNEKLKNLENTLRMTESELDSAIVKREQLKKEQGSYANENKALNSEIDDCLLRILEYERINKELQN